MIAPSSVIKRSERVEFRRLGDGDGAVLLRLDTGAYHGVNDVGALVWTLLDEARFDAVLAAVSAELVDAPPSLLDEISAYLEELEERGLVSISRPDDAQT